MAHGSGVRADFIRDLRSGSLRTTLKNSQKLLFKLSPRMSAQEAEFVALLEAIKAHHESLCVYTDSRYAFGVVHDFMAQWQTAQVPHGCRSVDKTF
uniref:RNase H type-1 domain-containing protein n=1 Tax=Anguilla anguilla TaxID=7936 RepID=A0A0E9SDZ1_ANGAN